MYTVLIVEDEILVCAGLKNMIQWSDMNMIIVGEARNGKEGLEKYHQLKPDIILTDIKMPVMDGLEMITQIREEDTVTRIIVLTCYEDFELVRQAFKIGISDYILKLKMLPEEMENVIKKVHGELLSSNVQADKGSYAAKQIDMENDARTKCRDYIMYQSCLCEEFRELSKGLQITEAGLVVCVMELIPSIHKQQTTDKQREERVEQVILNLFQNLLSKYKRGEVWIEKEKRYLIVLSFSDMNDERERETLLRDILSRIRFVMHSRINMNAVFGVSSFADSYQELNRLYTEAVGTLEEAVFLGEELLLYGNPKNQQKYESILGAFWEQMAKLDGLSDSYHKKMMKEISFLKSGRLPKSDGMKEILIGWIHWASFDSGIQKKEVMQRTLETAEQIRCSVSLNDMRQVMEEYSVAMYQGMKDTNMVSREVAQTILYIKSHYCEADISLSNAAQEVAMNKDYLSKLFKRETGIGFSDYANIQRIKKAQELLITTNMKSYEVAQKVGFQNESYFSRVFKKIVGVRPNEYKRCEADMKE